VLLVGSYHAVRENISFFLFSRPEGGNLRCNKTCRCATSNEVYALARVIQQSPNELLIFLSVLKSTVNCYLITPAKKQKKLVVGI
jgi:hypothetical protein